MSVRRKTGFVLTILALAALVTTLATLGMKVEDHLVSARLETPMKVRAPEAAPLQKVAVGETVYVPVYSHIHVHGGREAGLGVTLSIRNTDLEKPIVVNSLRYYGSDGTMLREYLEIPVLLEPLASADFLVEGRDPVGDGGAVFLVDWATQHLVSKPIIEAVMVYFEDNHALSFVRSGRPVASTQADE